MSDQPPRKRGLFDWLPAIVAMVSLGVLAFGTVKWYQAEQNNAAIGAYRVQVVEAGFGQLRTETESHMHGQDVRLDAGDKAQREIWDRVIRLEVQLENIRSSSNVPLKSRN